MLSIIIIAKNEEKLLPKLLESIKNQDYKDYEIIVSDANSTDNTRKIARKYNCKIVSGGLPPIGRNNGARIAKGDIFLFLDADALLPENFLSMNIEEFNKRKLTQATAILFPLSDKIIDKMLHMSYNTFAKTMQYFSPHAGGICIFCRKDVFLKSGGFDESIKIAEDHAFVKKCKKYGKFRILKSVPLLCDVRRFEKEGRLSVIKKYLRIAAHRSLKGEIYNPHFDYEMQGVNIR